MAFAKQNPHIPEGINASAEHPLKEFALLLSASLIGLVLTIVALVLLGRAVVPYVPFRYEQKLANLYWSKHQAAPQRSKLRAAEAALDALGARLGAHEDVPPDYTLTFHLLEADEQPNAFASLGGHIVVTTGLLRQVDSENALAMVLAHEIAHVTLRHPIQALTGGVAAQLVVGSVLGDGASFAVQGSLGQASNLTLLSFSRAMESAADARAMATVKKHYGHLNGADGFFIRMAAELDDAHWQEMFESHPGTAGRLQAIRAAMSLDDAHDHPVIALDARLRID